MTNIIRKINKFLHKPLVLFVVVIALLAPMISGSVDAHAQDAGALNLLPFDCLVETATCKNDLASAIVSFLFSLAPIFATLVLIWGGYLYFLGGFDQKTSGRRAISSAVIGYALILLAYGVSGGGDGVILTFIQDTLRGTTAEGINAEPTENIINAVIGFLTAIAGLVSVLTIIWGGYKFFLSTLPGAKEDGKQTIANGVIGLVIVLIATPIRNLVESTFGTQESQLSLETGSIVSIISTIVNNFLIPVSAVLTVFFLVWAGYDYIFSGGDQGKVKSAKDKLNNAIIGLIVVLLAVTISQLIVFFVQNTNL